MHLFCFSLGCAGSYEPLLMAYDISTKVLCAGSIILWLLYWKCFNEIPINTITNVSMEKDVIAILNLANLMYRSCSHM